MKYETGQHVVICPKDRVTFQRGAEGVIVDRNTSKKKGGKVVVLSVLIRWILHKKGVDCLRLKGKHRRKSHYGYTEYMKLGPDDMLRQELRNNGSIQPVEECAHCEFRLHRMLLGCPPNAKCQPKRRRR